MYGEPDIISDIRKGMVRIYGNNVGRKCLRISYKEKGPLENQERDYWTMLKMI